MINVDANATKLTREELDAATDEQLTAAAAQLFIIDLLRIDPVNEDVIKMVRLDQKH